MPHPNGLPDIFLDRSLGRIEVPRLLRGAGLRLTTLAEHYGIPADESVQDTDYLELAGASGWVVWAKDQRVRRVAAERLAIERARVRYFYLSSQDMPAAAMAERFLKHLSRITRACQTPGPLIYAVHDTRIERIQL